MKIFVAFLCLMASAFAQSPSPSPHPYYYINDYGAVPDCEVTPSGVIQWGTDASIGFNAAVDAWASGGGVGTIAALPGDYCLFGPVTQLTGGFHLTWFGGLGARLFVYQPNSTPFAFSAFDTVFKDWMILGNMATSSTIDCKHLFDSAGNITVTYEGLQVYGLYSYDPVRGGAIIAANVNMLNVHRSRFHGTVANPYGGAIVAPSMHVEDVVFQDYGTVGQGDYSKTWNEQLSWIVCALQTQVGQSFGAPRRAGCIIERARFDEGAKWQIWAPSASETQIPGARRQRVVVRDSAFMTPAVTQGRSINVKDTDDVEIVGNHFAIRWDEPAISCYGCGDILVRGVSWRALTAADGWPNTPPGLVMKILADYTSRSLDVRHAPGVIVQADFPTWVTKEGGIPVSATTPPACNGERAGKMFVDPTTDLLRICNGTAWKSYQPL